MTKKQLQIDVNNKVMSFIEQWTETQSDYEMSHYKRLFSCNAYVREYAGFANEKVILLQSYNTIVAAIYINHGEITGFDFLRYVYGYTATSARHIAKFFSLYSVPYTRRYVWYYVKGVKE